MGQRPDAPCESCKWAEWATNAEFIVCGFPLPIWVRRELLNPLTGGGGLADTIKKSTRHQCTTWEAHDE